MNSSFPEAIFRTGVMRSTKQWRLRGEKYRLEGNKCNSCGKTLWPKRRVCPVCQSRDLSLYEFNHHGTLRVAQYGPTAWNPMQLQGLQVYGLERILCIIRLNEEQEHYVAPSDMVDVLLNEIEDDVPVEMVLRKHRREPNGCWQYAYMWKPED